MQQIHQGSGSLSILPELVSGKALIITDRGLVKAGHVDRAAALLEEVAVFDQVRANPTESDMSRCAAFAREVEPSIIIGLGGGSSLDTAKAILFLLSRGGRMRDYRGTNQQKEPMLPFIAIPTTAGTGSECQSYALVSKDGSHEKMACGDPKALARDVILDPDLTASMPLSVARLTAVDAVSHALESLVSTKRTKESQKLSCQAMSFIEPVVGRVLRGDPSAKDREQMLYGASVAGQAIEASMLGGAHAAANPLTARLGIPHGQAVSTMLPHVMEFNCRDEEIMWIYRDLLPDPIRWVQDMHRLSRQDPIEVEETLIPQLAKDAAAQWTGQFNPVPLTVGDFERLYYHALEVV